MEIHVSKASRSDLDKLSILFDDYRVFYRKSSDPIGSKSFISERLDQNDSVIFVASDGNQMVGFTQLYPTFSSATMQKFYILNDLFVKPEVRGQGIGKSLLRHAQLFTKNENLKGLSLATALDNPAQYLYESLGWKKDVDFLHYFWHV
ncbi:MAG: GNAT family N-acetyltransferase [Bacteroidota bacterium]